MKIWVTTDWHLWSVEDRRHPYKGDTKLNEWYTKFCEKLNDDDVVIILGDLCDPQKADLKKLEEMIRNMPGYKMLCLGNHDELSKGQYLDMGFDSVSDGVVCDSILFTHKPVYVDEYVINIHGHLHTRMMINDWSNRHINAYRADCMPTELNDLLANATYRRADTNRVFDRADLKWTEKEFSTLDKEYISDIVDISEFVKNGVDGHPMDESAEEKEEPTEKLVIPVFEDIYKFSAWMKANIHYKNFDKLQRPVDTVRTKRGSYFDQAILEYQVLREMNYVPKLLFFMEYGDSKDVAGKSYVTVFCTDNNDKRDKSVYWFENAWSKEAGVKKFNSVDEIKDAIEKAHANEPEAQKYPNLEFKLVSPSKMVIGSDLRTLVGNIMNESSESPVEDDAEEDDIDDVKNYFDDTDRYRVVNEGSGGRSPLYYISDCRYETSVDSGQCLSPNIGNAVSMYYEDSKMTPHPDTVYLYGVIFDIEDHTIRISDMYMGQYWCTEQLPLYYIGELELLYNDDGTPASWKWGKDVVNESHDDLSMTEACKSLNAARNFVTDVKDLAKKYDANYFIVTDGASGIHNNGNEAVRAARVAHEKWEHKHGEDPDEDWSNAVAETAALFKKVPLSTANNIASTCVSKLTTYVKQYKDPKLKPKFIGFTDHDRTIMIELLGAGIEQYTRESYSDKLKEICKKLKADSTLAKFDEIKSFDNGDGDEGCIYINLKYPVQKESGKVDESAYTFELADKHEKLFFPDPINESSSDTKLYPVYIMLMHSGTTLANLIKKVTKSNFSHSSISFDSSMTKMYSFGRKFDSNPFIGTFKSENIRTKFFEGKDIPYALYMVPATKNEIDAMKRRLEFFTKNATKFKYDFVGLFKNYFGIADNPEYRYFCSRFVADIINAGRPAEKPYVVEPSLMKPEDFAHTTFAQYVTGGSLDMYDPMAVDGITKRMLREEEIRRIMLRKVDESVTRNLPNSYATSAMLAYECSIMDEAAFDKFIDYIKSFKIKFNKNGDVIITRREYENLEHHFKQSLKTIKAMESAGNVEGVKNELCKIHYMNNLISEHYLTAKYKQPANSSIDIRKKMIDLRSVMLNAFKQHLTYVTVREPRFNFQEYYNNSDYGRNFTVPKNVVSNIGKTIVTLLK